MSKIDYQALRELAKQATQGEWVAFISTGTGTYAVHTPGDKRCEDVIKWTGFDGQKNAENNARYIAAFNPEVVQALLDENESMCRDLIARNGEIEGLRKLVAELEETKSKLNEQREYYEGVISDGSKRIAELEKSEEQLINERDHAESALADMYFAATGDRPEWSNCFSFSDAVDAVVDRIADLEAKQPSPVVPDNTSESLAYAYKELTPEIMRGHIAVFERYGIAPNDSSTTIQALRIALDGIERSDAMLHGAEPVSQTYKLNQLSGNSPVTPDGWISCSERMPEMGERQCYVLAADFKNNYPPNIPNTQVGVYGDWFNDGNPTWDDGDGEDLHLKEVTHWMPLPEPPQEVNRG
ncbi:ead/Ea22-like family protein [Escherichia coli]